MRGMGKENKKLGRKRCSFISKAQIQSEALLPPLPVLHATTMRKSTHLAMFNACSMLITQISASALKLVEKKVQYKHHTLDV